MTALALPPITDLSPAEAIALGFSPIPLRATGDRKAPARDNWQDPTVSFSCDEWNTGESVGLRTGLQQDGTYLYVADYDHKPEKEIDAPANFSAALERIPDATRRRLVTADSTSRRGRYIIMRARRELRSKALRDEHGRKIGDFLGPGRQVVAPAHERMRQGNLGTIPVLDDDELNTVLDAIPYKHSPVNPAGAKPERHTAGARPASEREAIDEIKRRFDLVHYARKHWPGETRQERNGEIRILGYGGFLINEEKGVWDRFEEERDGRVLGGDCIELVGYQLYDDRWDHTDGTMFRAALEEAAQETGVELPPRQVDPPCEYAADDDLDALDADELRRRLRAAMAERQRWQQRALQLQAENEQLRTRNRFDTQAHGAEGIGPAGKRLTFIEIKKELDSAPPDDQGWRRIRPSYMAACSRQSKGTISTHLREFKDAGLLEKKVEKIYDPDTDTWHAATFIRTLVDFSDPSQVNIPSKPRGKQVCKNKMCESTNLVKETKVYCADCGTVQSQTVDLVNPPEAEFQTKTQSDDAPDDGLSLEMRNIEDDQLSSLSLSESRTQEAPPPPTPEFQTKTQVPATDIHHSAQPVQPAPAPDRAAANADYRKPPAAGPAPPAFDPLTARGVRAGLIAPDDPWIRDGFAAQAVALTRGGP